MPKRLFGRNNANPVVNIKRPAYAMATSDGESAEITMYGDIYEQQPTDWFGEPVEGQYVLLTDFLEDLKQISGCTSITIRMNSYGGDAGASNTIHNRLRELARGGAKLTCIVDGVAMSGGSLIMCSCDTVRANPSSLIMIHKCWQFLWGGYNADELRDQATEQDAWDKMQSEIYQRKTGLSNTVIMHMMSETTYMTGREALDKGFVDELIEDAEPLSIAASADGRSLIVRGKTMHLAPGMFAPDSIPTVKSEAQAPVDTNTHQPAQTGGQNGGKTMANTLEELRTENPALAESLMAEARAAVSASGAAAPVATPAAAAPATPAANPAPATEQTGDPVADERKRIQDIDALAGLFDAETINSAKYGDTACSAQEMVYRAAKKAAKQGNKFLAALEGDTAASGAQQIGAASSGPMNPSGELTEEQSIAQARADAKAFNESKKEVR